MERYGDLDGKEGEEKQWNYGRKEGKKKEGEHEGGRKRWKGGLPLVQGTRHRLKRSHRTDDKEGDKKEKGEKSKGRDLRWRGERDFWNEVIEGSEGTMSSISENSSIFVSWHHHYETHGLWDSSSTQLFPLYTPKTCSSLGPKFRTPWDSTSTDTLEISVLGILFSLEPMTDSLTV